MAQATQIVTFTTDRHWDDVASFIESIKSRPELEDVVMLTSAKKDSAFVVADYYVNGIDVTVVRVWNDAEELAAHRADPVVVASIDVMKSYGWDVIDA
jgi:hypothetical protein